MNLQDFLNIYFLNPLRADEGYNIVNTVAYAVIALLLLFVV